MTWISEFAKAAAVTDQLEPGEHHLSLLAAGLMGEAGSILSEEKKRLRDGDAYAAAYQSRVCEEIGDFLWYYVRLVALLDPELVSTLDGTSGVQPRTKAGRPLVSAIGLGAAVGKILIAIREGAKPSLEVRPLLQDVWTSLVAVSHHV